MVYDTVVYHPSLTRLIKFLDSSAGREKVLRLLQYLSRFLAVQQSSLLAKQLQAQFTFVRKILRFLKPLNHLQAAAKFYDNKLSGDSLIRYANIVKNLAYAGYLTLDQVNLLRILKIIPVTPLSGKKIPRWTNICWFIGLLSGIVLDLRNMHLSQTRILALLSEQEKADTDDKKLLNTAYKQRYAATRRLIWDAIDSFIVLNNLNYLHNQDGYIALGGIATSLFGLQDLWKAASKN
ncbi:hypothetical protein HG535_0A08870 [Zygotorulaspora mrakii]|uniref:Peroxisomal membrane protein PMP27 n=1 Tax=Zygotorulaspora mrakii TaxID=42260 RepID=A0A7H9AWZ7_ZYGMR|nr:uncharacterized protein HG535_0A08870 [Zygotorulaspora mrakii]QLG70940.1 hypothetical protein HG535_0A08870 [Zygotorulaspora mrakii]